MKNWLFFASGSISVTWAVLDIFGYTVNQVTGRSMQPTLNPDAYSYQHGQPQWNRFLDWVLIAPSNGSNVSVGDIVTINNPLEPKDRDIKRVIATEHQRVRTWCYKNRTVKVPAGHLWVEGDNNFNSKDSNRYGPVPASLVFGKAIAVVFPPWRFQKLQSDLPLTAFNKLLASEQESIQEEFFDLD